MIKRLLSLFACCMIHAANAQEKVVGGDLSLVPAYEQAGDIWLDADGKPINTTYKDGMITFAHDVAGWNSVRCRLLVDPSADSFAATCQDIDYVKKFGKRVKDAGMKFLLDIFYSDTWADVSTQWIPKSWNFNRSTNVNDVAQKVKTYTTSVLNELAAYGATPDFVQIGNEVSYGMLWDSAEGANKSNAFYLGKTAADYANQIKRFGQLLNAAAKGVRESNCSQAKIILHSERTASVDATINFYDWVEGTGGFTDYDIIGLSYYPFWHGTLSMLEAAIKELSGTFEKEIHIVETGYFNNSDVKAQTYDTKATWAYSPAGQAAFLKDLVQMLKQYDNVTGLYYFQPEECGNGADDAEVKHVMDNWDGRGFWQLLWKSGTHALQSNAALMTLKTFATEEEAQEKDISGQFENLDFQDCKYYSGDEGSWVSTCPGWTINDNQGWSNSPWPVVVNEWHSNMVDGYALQGWNASGNTLTAGNIIHQSLDNLPAGTYTITAVVHTDAQGIELFANDNATAVTTTSQWGTAYETKVTAELTAPGTLTIGLRIPENLQLSSDINLYADNFKVAYSNITTGIDNVTESPSVKARGWFDINGRRLNGTPAQKGIYINNGNKVLVK